MTTVPMDAATYFFGASYYDYVLARKRRQVKGALPGTPRKALFLIYPEHGLLPSHLRTLAYFKAKGVSATVISNVPLSPQDEATLLAHCSCYIERPNFGYDFGGYRDGVLSLADTLDDTEELIFINDSAWFPLYPDSDWLADVAALDVDFAGTVTNYHKSAMPLVAGSPFNQDYRDNDRNFFYGSFSLWVGPKILRDAGFLRFWKTLALTSHKKKVIWRGEIGLSLWVRENGYRHAATFDVTGLRAALNTLPDARLYEIAQNMIILGSPRVSAYHEKTLAEMAPEARQALIDRILTITDRQSAAYSLAYFMALELKHPFLKKSPLRENAKCALITKRILEQIGTPAAQEALDEIAQYHTQFLSDDNT